MKQTLLSLLWGLLPIVAYADPVNIQWIFYNLNPSNHTAEVTYDPSGNTHYPGDWIIPASITYNGINYSVTSIGPEAFFQCTNLTSITIPNSVTTIGDWAFGGCVGLASISIPNSLTFLGGYFEDTAWFNNQPDGLIYLGRFAIGYKGDMPANTSITIEDGTLGIVGYAFAGYNNLVNVTIPNGVTFIGNNAFEGCI